MTEKSQKFAHEAVDDEDSIEDMYLTFEVDTEEYAVCIETVTEIVTNQRIIPAPDMPPYLAGVINLRGKVVPLMDVRVRFGLPKKAYDDRTCTIVVEIDEVPTGLMVDRVKDVLEIPKNKIEPPKYGKGDGIIQGMGKRNEQVSFIISLSQLLSAQRIDIDQLREITGKE
ncbi:MAG: purine-binding chemotaxis protein CheW [Candidatus Magnetomorum sp.]|nr:purine-binding chemotaxis protein CheW [Candidatus Magnetomorum sp.]